MDKLKVGTKNIEKLLIVNDHEFELESSFESSGPTSLPDGDIALNLAYKDRIEDEAEALMESETERIYEFINEKKLEDYIEVYGNNVKQKIINGTQMYTPYVALVGKLKWMPYRQNMKYKKNP